MQKCKNLVVKLKTKSLNSTKRKVLLYKNANPNPNPNYCCPLQQPRWDKHRSDQHIAVPIVLGIPLHFGCKTLCLRTLRLRLLLNLRFFFCVFLCVISLHSALPLIAVTNSSDYVIVCKLCVMCMCCSHMQWVSGEALSPWRTAHNQQPQRLLRSVQVSRTLESGVLKKPGIGLNCQMVQYLDLRRFVEVQSLLVKLKQNEK